jgi:hypothetical protein
MGSGRWSVSAYHNHIASLAAAGKGAFDYSSNALQSGNLRVHQTLDPRGLLMRESRDSNEHPLSNAIMISLDVTGSMGHVARAIHKDLPRLHELLLGQKFITDPQILFSAVGDATCDSVPLQVGQFESDNRMDQNLENMILEGGGGGQKTESYELMLYIAAHHTSIDCWEKRKRKGYLFIIGDEMAYPAVKAREVRSLMTKEIETDISLQTIAAQAMQKYHVFYILPGGASYGDDTQVIQFWERLIGPERVIRLQSPNETSERIAMTIGLKEGAITPRVQISQAENADVKPSARRRVARALGLIRPHSKAAVIDGSRRL